MRYLRPSLVHIYFGTLLLVIGFIVGLAFLTMPPTYAGDEKDAARSYIESQLTKDYPLAADWQFVSQSKAHALGHEAWRIQFAHDTKTVCYYEWVQSHWRNSTRGSC